jgi:BirA family transcriptional regulator, biotin operon repressor / biotin---[acetyl-CoA-carboxylase] ligase
MNERTLPGLSTRSLGRPTRHFSEVTSTQDLLRSLARDGAGHGTAVVADHQTEGRGRQGRPWFSLPAPQLYASVLLIPPIPLVRIPVLSIAAGLAVAQAVEALGAPGVRIKWPNDVLIAGRKTSGILGERVIVRGSDSAVLLGIGVNMTADPEQFPADLRGRATAISLHTAGKGPIDRFRLLSAIYGDFERFYDEIVRGDLGAVQTGFRTRWAYAGREIQVRVGDRTIRGVAEEIDSDGALLLQAVNRGSVRIVTGEILPL